MKRTSPENLTVENCMRSQILGHRTLIFCLLTTMATTGCGHFSPKLSPPIDVSLIPNDCANQDKIIRWLDGQSKGEWNENVAQIRARMWHVRYSCNIL